MFSDGLRLLLAGEDDIELIGAVTHGSAGLEVCARERPDVALVDVDLPDLDGIAVAERIAAGTPSTHVVVVSALSTADVVGRAIDAGAVGFVSKARAADELVRIVRSAADGEAVFEMPGRPDVIFIRGRRSASGARVKRNLSPREVDVLQGLADGLSTAELASKLFVSPRTIQGHVQSILTKLDARSKLEAVLRGLRLGVVRLGSRPSAPH